MTSTFEESYQALSRGASRRESQSPGRSQSGKLSRLRSESTSPLPRQRPMPWQESSTFFSDVYALDRRARDDSRSLVEQHVFGFRASDASHTSEAQQGSRQALKLKGSRSTSVTSSTSDENRPTAVLRRGRRSSKNMIPSSHDQRSGHARDKSATPPPSQGGRAVSSPSVQNTSRSTTVTSVACENRRSPTDESRTPSASQQPLFTGNTSARPTAEKALQLSRSSSPKAHPDLSGWNLHCHGLTTDANCRWTRDSSRGQPDFITSFIRHYEAHKDPLTEWAISCTGEKNRQAMGPWFIGQAMIDGKLEVFSFRRCWSTSQNIYYIGFGAAKVRQNRRPSGKGRGRGIKARETSR